MDVKTTGRATRSSVTLLWGGDAPVTLPGSVKALQPGVNENVSTDLFHSLGGYPEWIEIIASGKLKAVCIEHTFLDGDYHCISCGHNRDSAKETTNAVQ